jgi:broad specificity phosphatase PhoE
MIYVLRHGQTDHNTTGHLEYDIGLNGAGLKQASKITGHYDVILCSTLRRAQQTLAHSQITYGRLQPSELCREMRVEITDIKINENLADVAESSEELRARANQFRQLLRLYPKHKKILVVSHSMFIKELTGYHLANAELREYNL